MTQQEVIQLLKSGDFTIYYHDSGQCSLYKGKLKGDYPSELDKSPVYEFTIFDEGYLPEVVVLLAKALGGNTGTI